jgi:predicted acetyltransferase
MEANSISTSTFGLQPSAFEIGPVRQDELDAMLGVMCAAYELPFAAARPIFYADPYFELENKRVLRVDGHIVSCLTITEARCWIGKAVVPLAGIAGLATLPHAQRQGYAGLLLTATLQTLDERGIGLVGLYPYDDLYYRRLGWETASTACHLSLMPESLPHFPESANVRPACPDDTPHMQRLYDAYARERTLHAVRDEKRWEYLSDRVPERHVYAGLKGNIEGYLLYDFQPGTVQVGTQKAAVLPSLRIMELCAATQAARRGLIGYLARQTGIGNIEYEGAWPTLNASGFLDVPYPAGASNTFATMQMVSAVMLRVVNFPRLLHALRPNWNDFNGGLTLALHDDHLPRQTNTVTIEGNGRGLPEVSSQNIEAEKERQGDEANQSKILSSSGVAGDVRTWSQVVIGYMSGEDACALDLLRASSEQAAVLVGRLFPARTPFLPAPDHF